MSRVACSSIKHRSQDKVVRHNARHLFRPTSTGPATAGLVGEKGLEHILCDFHGTLSSFQCLSESIVFDFNADRTAIGGLHECTHEVSPVHLAITRDAWLMPFQRVGQYAHVVDSVPADLHVLGVQMKQLVLEFLERAGGIHVLQDKMRWIVVEPKVG
jgi:hypothetical protein